MSAIGGYFELELAPGRPYHPDAVALNTGRNALEYILLANGFSKLYLPYYTCHVLLQPLERLGIPYEYYGIGPDFEPLFDYDRLAGGDAFLYTDYYGLKTAFARELARRVPQLIVDNAQAFFAPAPASGHAFYSARKFFGVPDGAYAYTSGKPLTELPQDISVERFGHLLLRSELGAENGYAAFVANDQALDNNPVKAMSVLTSRLLAAIPYASVARQRRSNYEVLYEALKDRNGIDLPLPDDAVPMVYPFLDTAGNGRLRSHLIANRIYVAQYWPEVPALRPPGTTEHEFATNLIPLPIDQRLSAAHLHTIINTISNAH